jgi:predicted transcriptional regulator
MTSKREQLIKDLAVYIIKRNKENYDDMGEIEESFNEFGVTEETVEAYMKDLVSEVFVEVKAEQQFISEFLYEW